MPDFHLNWVDDYFYNDQKQLSVNWDGMTDYCNQHFPNIEPNVLWHEVSKVWLHKIKSLCKASMFFQESDNFLMLLPQENVEALNESLEGLVQQVMVAMPGVVKASGYGKNVLIAFDNLEDYSTYLSTVKQPVQEDMPGLYLNDGYGHFVLNWHAMNDAAGLMAHELTHSCTTHLPLPVWLDEAIADKVEDNLCGTSEFILDQAVLDAHKEYWNTERLLGFYKGDSFFYQDIGQPLSYHLARYILEKLIDNNEKWVAFCNQSVCTDAGFKSLQENYQLLLNELIEELVGINVEVPNDIEYR